MPRYFAKALALFLASCSTRSPPAPSVSAVACPSPSMIEAIHAATFYFEHGTYFDGQAVLAHALAPSQDTLDATTRGLLDKLVAVERSIANEPDRALRDLENLRVSFRDWPCLSESLHQHFHKRLAPLP